MSNCNCCFEDYVVKCSEEIRVNAKLEPSTTYKWVITDKFDKQYSSLFSTDGDGFWEIPVALLPPGLLTEFSGSFNLQVFESGNDCGVVSLLIAQRVDCINFTVRGGSREKNTLGCEF